VIGLGRVGCPRTICAASVEGGVSAPAASCCSWRAGAAGCDRAVEVRAVIAVCQLGVRERWCLRVAAAHVLGETPDAVGVVSFHAEVLAGDEPVGALAGTGCLDVGGLLAGLPAAGDDERAGDGRALGAVDVLRVAEANTAEIVPGQGSLALRCFRLCFAWQALRLWRASGRSAAAAMPTSAVPAAQPDKGVLQRRECTTKIAIVEGDASAERRIQRRGRDRRHPRRPLLGPAPLPLGVVCDERRAQLGSNKAWVRPQNQLVNQVDQQKRAGARAETLTVRRDLYGFQAASMVHLHGDAS
jgi:hypothetical protein